MQNQTNSKDIQSLLNRYNQEIDVLKEKLLNGESWDNLVENRNTVTQLAIALQNEQKKTNTEVSSEVST